MLRVALPERGKRMVALTEGELETLARAGGVAPPAR